MYALYHATIVVGVNEIDSDSDWAKRFRFFDPNLHECDWNTVALVNEYDDDGTKFRTLYSEGEHGFFCGELTASSKNDTDNAVALSNEAMSLIDNDTHHGSKDDRIRHIHLSKLFYAPNPVFCSVPWLTFARFCMRELPQARVD